MSQRALIIDGNSIINRAFFGIKGMAATDGFPTNALYGFLSIYHGVLAEIKPQYIAVAFDLKGPTFRHLEFDNYKAGRKGMPDELALQLPVLKEILRAMGVVILELPGFEADDLIGTTARFMSNQGVYSYLLTGDKDALQLVDEWVSVYYHGTKNKVIYNPELVKEDLGVYPNRVIDLKGLMGDSSDNIPGVPSIGKVTANKLLEAFDNVENLIQNAGQIANARQRDLIETHAEQALLSKRLATIETQVPVELILSDFEPNIVDREALVSLFQRYNLHSFLVKLAKDTQVLIPDVEQTQAAQGETAEAFEVLIDPSHFEAAWPTASPEPICMQLLYDKSTIVADALLGMAFVMDNKGFWVPAGATDAFIDYLKGLYPSGLGLSIKGHDIKNAVLMFKAKGLDQVVPAFDSSIAMYLLDANRKSYALNDIALDILGLSAPSEEDLLGKGAKRLLYQAVAEADLRAYAQACLKTHMALEPQLIKRMADLGLEKLFNEVEMPLVRVLAHMEYDGFNVDLESLDQLDQVVSQELTSLEALIFDLAGMPFNINSPKQLGTVLFETLALPTDKKTKTGFSTSHEVLLALEEKHPIIAHIMSYRAYSKIKSTYIDGLKAVVNPITGRVHSSLNQTVAATGRLSSTEPNLQNIPIKLAIGRELRKVFVPRNAQWRLIDADYSQIELRILAHMSNDEMLKKAYTEGIDIHALTASQVFEVALDQITPQLRSRAKEVNFGIVYGMSDFGLADNLKIPRKTAKLYIENYFAKYPSVATFMKQCKEDAAANGYAETLLGRKRFIPEISNKNFNIRQYGERMAMNTPIQGTAADIIKVAMIKVFLALEEAGLQSRLILQVHDELIVESPMEEIERASACVTEAMTQALQLCVPLDVDLHVGKSWYEAK